jgi:hypothetical protein
VLSTLPIPPWLGHSPTGKIPIGSVISAATWNFGAAAVFCCALSTGISKREQKPQKGFLVPDQGCSADKHILSTFAAQFHSILESRILLSRLHILYQSCLRAVTGRVYTDATISVANIATGHVQECSNGTATAKQASCQDKATLKNVCNTAPNALKELQCSVQSISDGQGVCELCGQQNQKCCSGALLHRSLARY